MRFLYARRAHDSGGRYTSSGNTVIATGSESSVVFHTADAVGLRPRLSQYSRAADVEVFVSQYNVKSSRTWSFVGVLVASSSPYVHFANPGCTSMNPASPAGESFKPYPIACGRAV